MYLYIDIETIPTQDANERQRIADTITPPANYKSAEAIDKWNAFSKPGAVDEAVSKTSFDGALGAICCIGMAFNDGEPKTFTGDERDILSAFMADCEIIYSLKRRRRPAIVGHNVLEFDMRFIVQRCIVHGVALASWWPLDPKPWSGDVDDTMTMWAGFRNRVSLDKLCRALGIEGKGDTTGADVARLYAEGKISEIAEYCADDVRRTRAVHQRMIRVLRPQSAANEFVA